MTSTSSSEAGSRALPVPVTSFSYQDMSAAAPFPVKETLAAGPEKEQQPPAAPGLSATEVEDLLNHARSEAAAQTEARLKSELEAKSEAEAEKIRDALALFQDERREYFSRVELSVVQLALAIAAKILHRESQVDPMLVAALVRVAIDKLHDGSSVSVHVTPPEAEKWRAFLANPVNGATIEVIEDAHLGVGECVLETELGSANFSMEAQMKEIELGFFDLLAQRPVIK